MTSSSVVVLAAGRGTRFGGLKQLAAVGAGGEAIIDILLRRAAAAGIEHAVIVVSPEVRDQVVAHLAASAVDLPVEFAVQARPLGTADALLAARAAVAGSCVVVNADDVYPAAAFSLLAGHLRDAPATEHAMVAFRVSRTMIEERPGWRALIEVDESTLVAIREGLVAQSAAALQFEREGSIRPLRGDECVSMNIWAFRPSVFAALEAAVAAHRAEVRDGELFLPDVVAAMVRAGEMIRVLVSEDVCIGLTHQEDVAAVRRVLS